MQRVEEWRSVRDFEGLYLVSNTGKVKSVKTNRMLKPRNVSKGYLSVRLTRGNEEKENLVHRLVAIAFIEKPFWNMEVDHIDGNKGNNSVDNLRWVTHKTNCNTPLFRQAIGATNIKEVKNIKRAKRVRRKVALTK